MNNPYAPTTKKYKNKTTTRQIGTSTYAFDSKAEATYFDLLYKKAQDGEIHDLRLQPEFEIFNGFSISTTKTKSGVSKIGSMKYGPDFSYLDKYGKKVVVEVKGMKTTSYIQRFKLFLALAYTKYKVSTFIEVNSGKETVYYTDTTTIQS